MLALALLLSVWAAAPASAGDTDGGVRAAIAAGQSARVIMQFATPAERDAAFNRLLDRGAAVRAVAVSYTHLTLPTNREV